MTPRAHILGLLPRWIATVLLTTFLVSTSRGALAQGPLLRINRSGVAIESIEWGFSGEETVPWMPAEQYAPVTVMVSGGDKSIEGAVILEYPQDASQNAKIVAPFATTPNTTTLVQLLACLPRSCAWMKLTLTDGSRSVVKDFRDTVGESALPQQKSSPCRLGLVGGVEIARTITKGLDPRQMQVAIMPTPGVAATTPSPTTTEWWDTADTAKISVLPDAWIAYEGLDVVIAREQDVRQAPAPAREALLEWVRAGGRLVLQTSQAGSRTFEAVPDDVRTYVTLDEPLELTPGHDVAQIIQRSSALAPATSPARLLHVTGEGLKAGWVARYDANEKPDANSGFVAYGPSGMGMVALVGMNPKRVCGIDLDAHDALWRDMIEPVLPTWAAKAPSAQTWNPWSQSSGSDNATSSAIKGVLDSITTPPSVGAGFFTVTMLTIGVLGLAIGPVGRVILKRRKWLSVSWLAAFACIGVVSIAGWLIPAVLRSGHTTMARWSMVDAVCDDAGVVKQCWTTSLTGIFAGKPGTMTLPNPKAANGTGTTDGSWMRGVSTVTYYRASGTRQSPLTMVYLPGGPSQRDGLLAQPLELGQWTFRAIMEQASHAPQALSTLTLDLSQQNGQLTLRVRGLPDGARVNEAEVLLPDATVGLHVVEQPDARLSVLTGGTASYREAFDALTSAAYGDASPYATPPPDRGRTPLPIARSRAAALEARIRGGAAVGVHLVITGTRVDWDDARWKPFSTSQMLIVRALLPVTSVRGFTPEAFTAPKPVLPQEQTTLLPPTAPDTGQEEPTEDAK